MIGAMEAIRCVAARLSAPSQSSCASYWAHSVRNSTPSTGTEAALKKILAVDEQSEDVPPSLSVGYSSGQRGQTVNLLGSALHWFESSSYHHFTSLAGRAGEYQKGTKHSVHRHLRDFV
jgi:hypothetical protein